MITLPVLTSSLILLAGVIDDLRSRKFHNELFLACCAVALSVVAVLSGWQGILFSMVGFFSGVAIFLPLVLFGIVGAGDMKLLAAFGIVAGWSAVVSVAVLSLIWGALFGLIRIVIAGQGRVLIRNLFAIVMLRTRENLELHRIPFTIGLLMGWMSYLILQRMQ